MSKNPYLARLRELAPEVETALEAEFPLPQMTERQTRRPDLMLHPLDPCAAHLVLVSKMGALFPALAACCLICITTPFRAPLPIAVDLIVEILAVVAGLAVLAVQQLEQDAGQWRRPRRGEEESVSHLRFLGLQFYPARMSAAG